MAYRDLDPKTAQRELQGDKTIRILDVRTQPEYQAYHLPGALLIPVQELPRRIGEIDQRGKWLVHCEHGRRSLTACELLVAAGCKDVANLRGGLANWLHCGLPVEK